MQHTHHHFLLYHVILENSWLVSSKQYGSNLAHFGRIYQVESLRSGIRSKPRGHNMTNHNIFGCHSSGLTTFKQIYTTSLSIKSYIRVFIFFSAILYSLKSRNPPSVPTVGAVSSSSSRQYSRSAFSSIAATIFFPSFSHIARLFVA
jgi:hypothetical protein